MTPPSLNSWTAIERAAELAADFSNGNPGRVADELNTMKQAEAIAVALHISEYLSPAKRALLVNLVLEA